MKKSLSPRATALVAGAAVLAIVVVGYLALISPRRSEAAELQGQIAETQQALDRSRAALRASPQRIRAADLFRLAKAMPARTDMPGLLLQLNRGAAETGITFESLTPQQISSRGGYQVVPLEVVFQGSFHDLAELLARLRSRVSVGQGELHATGRLLTVDRLDFTEGDAKFPQVRATLTVNAFVFGGSPPGSGGTAAPATGGNETGSGSSTTPSPPASSSGSDSTGSPAQAAGAGR